MRNTLGFIGIVVLSILIVLVIGFIWALFFFVSCDGLECLGTVYIFIYGAIAIPIINLILNFIWALSFGRDMADTNKILFIIAMPTLYGLFYLFLYLTSILV